MNICVMTDDNSGFTPQEAKNLGVTVLRMPILVEGKIYYEHDNIDEEMFYRYLEEGKDVRTSQPSPDDIIKIWKNLLQKYDQIVHIPMSSGLSSSTQTAIMLSNEDKFLNKVFVVDNHRISVTLKTAVKDALYLISQGLDGKQIKERLENHAYDSTIYIMVDLLKYLKKGGRITPAAALIGDALHLKPVLTILGGKLDAFGKVIGTKKAKALMIEAIKNDVKEKFKDVPSDQLVYQMGYTHNLEEANLFKDEVKKAFGLDDIEMDPLSLSISTHIGPGALAVTVSKIEKI